MIKLEAPMPLVETTTLLPNPLFSDVVSRNMEVQRRRSMNNVVYSYAKDEGTWRITLSFRLDRMKAYELLAFFESYNGDQIRLTDHLNQVYLVYFESNPFETTQSRRASPAGGNEEDSVTLIFEGTKL